MNSGVLRLYFNGEFITAIKFTSARQRKSLMQQLNETYQLNRQNKIVYYELTKE